MPHALHSQQLQVTTTNITSYRNNNITFKASSLQPLFAAINTHFTHHFLIHSGSFFLSSITSLSFFNYNNNSFSNSTTMGAILALFVVTFAMVFGNSAADPDLLQDICVADLAAGAKVNGFTCKDAANATAEDFFFAGIAKPGLTNNSFGSVVTAANVQKIPGLNTLGVSLARIDYAPGGINPPHTHPRATEIVFVLEGELDVGFITTANKLITKTIKKGEVFAFPKGLVHFQKNNGKVPAAVVAAFNSQLPGTQSIGATLFAATPEVPDNVLTAAFQVGTKQIKKIKSRFAPKA